MSCGGNPILVCFLPFCVFIWMLQNRKGWRQNVLDSSVFLGVDLTLAQSKNTELPHLTPTNTPSTPLCNCL